MPREKYQFIELLLGLREEYVKNKKLLATLKELIEVDGKQSSRVRFGFDHELRTIRMTILEKQNGITRLVSHIVGYNVREDSTYSIVEEQKGFTIVRDNFIPKEYEIKITNQELFNEIAGEVAGSRILNLEEAFIPLGTFQNVRLSHSGLQISGNFYKINLKLHPLFRYDAITDTAIAIPCGKWGSGLMESFLRAEIAACFIPEEYRKIIDENLEHFYPNIIAMVQAGLGKGQKMKIKVYNEKRIIGDVTTVWVDKKRPLKYYERDV